MTTWRESTAVRSTSAVIALALLLLHGCAARGVQPTAPARATARRSRARFARPARPLRQRRLRPRALGRRGLSLRTAETLYSLNASRFMIPASNQKLLTTAAAAERLGWDYRFTTRIFATGPISRRHARRRSRHRRKRRSDHQPAASGALARVRRLGRSAARQRHPDHQRPRHRRRQRASPSPGGASAGRGTTSGTATARRSARSSTTRTRSRCSSVPACDRERPRIISTSPLGSGMVIDHGVTTAAAGTRDQGRHRAGPRHPVSRGPRADCGRRKAVTVLAAVDNPDAALSQRVS